MYQQDSSRRARENGDECTYKVKWAEKPIEATEGPTGDYVSGVDILKWELVINRGTEGPSVKGVGMGWT